MATVIQSFLVLALLALSGGAALAQDNAFDIKGIRIGGTEAEIKGKFSSVMCQETKSRELGDRSCYIHKDTYGGATAAFLYYLRAGKVTGGLVVFASADFDLIVQAMKARFGEPTKQEKSKVQNRMGATFDNDVLTWSREGALLKAERRAGKIDEALVSLHSDENLSKLDERSREAAKKRAGDL